MNILYVNLNMSFQCILHYPNRNMPVSEPKHSNNEIGLMAYYLGAYYIVCVMFAMY